MSKLPDTDEQLNGWGDFKRSVGLNKLQTRKVVAAHVNVAKAAFAPSKKNAKNAAASIGKSKLAATAVRIGANVVAPGSGEFIAGAAKAEAAKQDAESANAAANARLQQLQAEAKKAEAEIAAAGGGAATQAEAGKETARRWLLRGSVALLMVGASLQLLKNRKNKGNRHGATA